MGDAGIRWLFGLAELGVVVIVLGAMTLWARRGVRARRERTRHEIAGSEFPPQQP